MTRWRTAAQNLGLVVASLVVSLYLGEAALRLLNPCTVATLARPFGAMDPRPKAQVVADFRAGGTDAYPHHPAVTDPAATEVVFSGVAHVWTVGCAENGYWTGFTSDRYGFNNPDEVWDRSALDVVVAGDSFTAGYCVFNRDHYLTTLRRGRNVLNLGQASANPLTELAAVREYADGRRTSVLLVQYFDNDLLEASRSAANPILRRYLDDPGYIQGLAAQRDAVDRRLKDRLDRLLARELAALDRTGRPSPTDILLLRKFRHTLGLVRTERRFADPCQDVRKTPVDAALRRFGVQLIDGWQALAARLHARLAVAYFPTWHELACPAYPADFPTFKSLLDARGVPLIDTRAAFAGAPLDRVFPYRGFAHYTPAGNRLIGEHLASRLDALSAPR
ncbi:MAG: hypothetical protein VW405_01455 [Rhodospirillaceae bacterium]